jgi:hypothetical protein
MNSIATTVRMGAAACAIAAAATVVSAPVAQATPLMPAPTATGIGSALGSATCFVPVFNSTECAVGAATIPGAFYLGPNDPTPPVRTDILKVNPIPVFLLIPVLGVPLAGWWASLDLEVCVGGISARVGGYGTLTASLGSGC